MDAAANENLQQQQFHEEKILKTSFRDLIYNLLWKKQNTEESVNKLKKTSEIVNFKFPDGMRKNENGASVCDIRNDKIITSDDSNSKSVFNAEIVLKANSKMIDINNSFMESFDGEEDKLEIDKVLDADILNDIDVNSAITKMNANANQIVDVELSSETNRMRIAMGVLIRLILPVVHGVTRRLRGIGAGLNILNIISHIRSSRGSLTSMLAYAANTVSMSLSSVQVRHTINPILKVMKLKRGSDDNAKSLTFDRNPNIPLLSPQPLLAIEDGPEKCVTCSIMAEPPPGIPIIADVIFIHGLHGSQVNTWKQGLWNSEGRRVHFERPPKPPVRRPKRPRHTRASIINPPHLSKRPRFDKYEILSDSEMTPTINETLNDEINWNQSRFEYTCGEPGEVEFLDDVEFSFPTFRLRVEDDIHPHRDEKRESPKRKFFRKNQKSVSIDENYSRCWPGDWLPIDCPGVRVIALNYTTDPYLWRPIWVRKRNRTSLTERSREMTQHLIEKGVGVGRPIIWVGHSKGGIFIKQIIVDAWESGRTASENLWRSSKGVLFYSVPHRGSPLADFNLPLLRQSVELTEIQKNCSSILELHRRFVALYHGGQLKIEVFSFVETALTLMSVLYLRIVGVDSADPGIGEVCGIHLDHREICKPRNRDCMLYTELVKIIKKVT